MKTLPIKLEHINKKFGERIVLKDFSAEFKDNCITCLMGPSGVGKTTVLNIVLGLLKPDSGNVLGLDNRKISVVFQEDRLLNWLNAIDNVAFVGNEPVTEDKIIALLNELGLKDSLYDSINKLSGGMKRRVAIARALINNAEILILDEPFKGLDEDTKENVMSIVKQYSKEKCVILVTHDISETKFLEAEIIDMN